MKNFKANLSNTQENTMNLKDARAYTVGAAIAQVAQFLKDGSLTRQVALVPMSPLAGGRPRKSSVLRRKTLTLPWLTWRPLKKRRLKKHLEQW